MALRVLQVEVFSFGFRFWQLQFEKFLVDLSIPKSSIYPPTFRICITLGRHLTVYAPPRSQSLNPEPSSLIMQSILRRLMRNLRRVM